MLDAAPHGGWLSLTPGCVLPPPPVHRGPQGYPMPAPAWFALETPPQREARAIDMLSPHGIDCWCPTEPVWRVPRSGPRVAVQVERRILPRIVFARFTGFPNWDVMFASRHVSGFIGASGRPRAITDDEMMAMTTVPGRISELRAAKADAMRIRPGDTATVLDGAMAGWQVTVSAVDGDIAAFVVPILGDRVTRMSVARMVKSAPLAMSA